MESPCTAARDAKGMESDLFFRRCRKVPAVGKDPRSVRREDGTPNKRVDNEVDFENRKIRNEGAGPNSYKERFRIKLDCFATKVVIPFRNSYFFGQSCGIRLRRFGQNDTSRRCSASFFL